MMSGRWGGSLQWTEYRIGANSFQLHKKPLFFRVQSLILQSSLAVGEYFAEYIKKGPSMAALTNQSTVRAV